MNTGIWKIMSLPSSFIDCFCYYYHDIESFVSILLLFKAHYFACFLYDCVKSYSRSFAKVSSPRSKTFLIYGKKRKAYVLFCSLLQHTHYRWQVGLVVNTPGYSDDDPGSIPGGGKKEISISLRLSRASEGTFSRGSPSLLMFMS